ncbi:MAG: molybdenum cofactor guanylyltransferase [Halobacteriales archaeon]
MRAGVVLAGGRSTRFGDADKAVAELAGTPMIRRVADRLLPAVDDLVVNCRADQVDAIGPALAGLPADVTYAPDPEPDLGPLAGIATGLDATEAEYAAVVACDMPFVEPTLIEHLFDRAAGHDAAVPRIGDGWYQTTQAVYRTDPTVAACERALDRGDRRVVAAFDDLDVVEVPEDEVSQHAGLGTFDNVNTREEFDRAAARLANDRAGGGT